MKKYFAKYIPVDKPYKDGDLIQREWYPPTRGFERVITIYKTGMQSLSEKKVELFLCSLDIQPGDTFIDNVGRVWKDAEECDVKVAIELNETKSDYGICYKIIGQISKDAIWVKEGDEFNEDEVSRHHICYDSPGNIGYCFHCRRSKGCDSEDYDYVIKGPCGHWH
jgi:hypothetical protein